MGTGFGGTYVLTFDQTRIDGLPAKPGRMPHVGQVWTWHGEAVRLDGPQSTLLLGTALGETELRARVARAVRRRFDLPAITTPDLPPEDPEERAEATGGFVISDGQRSFTLVPVDGRTGGPQLLWCAEGLPVAGQRYEVTHVPQEAQTPSRVTAPDMGDVICFTEGTSILTEGGSKRVETLEPGDHVLTRDNGAQEILWVGKRRMSGARLYAMPQLRPVRLRAQALGHDMPDTDLLVSPHHRLLYTGRNARALFNTDEVLIAAADLVNDHTVFVDHSVREVTYVHIAFACHQIVWANGVPSESFHPASTTLDMIDPAQRAGLLEHFPDLERDLHSYGAYARRSLERSEAAILLHDVI